LGSIDGVVLRREETRKICVIGGRRRPKFGSAFSACGRSIALQKSGEKHQTIQGQDGEIQYAQFAQQSQVQEPEVLQEEAVSRVKQVTTQSVGENGSEPLVVELSAKRCVFFVFSKVLKFRFQILCENFSNLGVVFRL
jgi:hypothetical protein